MLLTSAEKQVMQIPCDPGEWLVKEIGEKYDDPKPAWNTEFTDLRVLEKKGIRKKGK